MGTEIQHLQTSELSKINQSRQGLRLQDASQDQIIQVLRYVFVLLGIPVKSYPDNKLEVPVLVNFIRGNMERFRLEEIKLAFELAVKGSFEIDLALYGEPFSVKYLTNVMKAYEVFRSAENKKSVLVSTEVKMNSIQRLGAITSLLSDETKELINQIGKEENKPLERIKLPFHDIHQKWMALFDKLKWNWEIPKSGGRFIKRYGMELDVHTFFQYKADQLQRVKEYLEARNQDIL